MGSLSVALLAFLYTVGVGYLAGRRTTTKVHQLEKAMNSNISALETKLVDIDKSVSYMTGYLEGTQSKKQDKDN